MQKPKNVRLTKTNIKMLNYIMQLENDKLEQERLAEAFVRQGFIEDKWENLGYKNAANQWHHAVVMFQEVNGLSDYDYFHGNAYGYIYEQKNSIEG